jgi:diguanylate cyclase (GGDEF)-like protein/PAS domain S-box-containing protein
MEDRERSRDELVREVDTLRRELAARRKDSAFSDDKWRLQQYLDVAGVIIVAIDADQKVMLINKKGCEILGYREDEIIGKNWFDRFVPRKIRPRIKDIFSRLMKGELEPAEFYENPLVTREGEERIISWKNALLRGEDGRVAGTLSSGLDITEQRKASEKLTLTQFSVDHTAVAVFWISKDARILYANDAACLSLGYSNEEIVSMRVYDFDPNFDKAAWSRHWKDLKERRSFTFESNHRRKDGSVFPVEITVNYQGFGGKEYNFAFAKDITNRKRAEAAMRQSENMLRTAVENLPFDFFVIDENGYYTMVNSACKENWGHLLGKRPEDIAPDAETLSIWKENNRRAFSGETVKGKVSYSIKDREGHFYNIISPIHADGRIRGILGVNIDITELEKAERKLEILNRHLIKTNKRLQMLALRDYHTGLYNYHYLEDIIDSEFQRAKRYENPLSVIIIDIDYFKSVNEMYGAQTGDLILKQMARQLKKIVRTYDIVIRFGGEEFAIICPSTDSHAVLNLANRVLNSINSYNFGTREQAVKLKLSIGVSSFPETRALKGMDLVESAEKVLNKAKDDGGNRVYHSTYFRKKKPGKAEEKASIGDLKRKLNRLTKKSNQNLVESIFAFAKTIELKDHYTGEHVEKTVHYATELARALKLPPDEVENIRQAAILHDLGKIGISDKILLKKKKLSKEELKKIKKHPQIAADILRPIQVLHDIIPYIFYHHERWDGSGYPTGLKGEEIPVGARIIALADVYQALSSDRAYRKAFTNKKVLRMLKDGSGTQFDPKIVEVFLKILKEKQG